MAAAFGSSRLIASAAWLSLAAVQLYADAAAAQLRLRTIDVRGQANKVLSLMTYTIVPDVTTSALSINNASSGNPELTMTQLGGGATLSRSVPIYVEGTLGYSRYDANYVLSGGQVDSVLPLKWNSFSASGGIGWDVALTDELWLRPIVNIALGTVASDLRVGQFLLGQITDREIDFLDGGTLNAYGYGGSLMLDWERIRGDTAIDVEARYSHLILETFGGTDASVSGRSIARTFNVWGRYRAPTGATLLERPLRYVVEVGHTRFLEENADVLGFRWMSSFGIGLELDTSKYDIIVTRVRLVARRMIGPGAQGASLGFAVSF